VTDIRSRDIGGLLSVLMSLPMSLRNEVIALMSFSTHISLERLNELFLIFGIVVMLLKATADFATFSSRKYELLRWDDDYF
jgi:hypothetical protein